MAMYASHIVMSAIAVDTLNTVHIGPYLQKKKVDKLKKDRETSQQVWQRTELQKLRL